MLIQHCLISGRTGDLLKCVLTRSYPPISNEETHGSESAFVEEQMRFFAYLFQNNRAYIYDDVEIMHEIHMNVFTIIV